MKKLLTLKLIILFFISFGCISIYATSIEIYNKTKDPNLILYFENGGSHQAYENGNLKNFPDKQRAYIQPWSSDPWNGKHHTPLKLDQPYKCSYDTIESQNIRYLLGNSNDPSFNKKDFELGNAPGNGAPWWIGGFFEFTREKGKDNFWDITNVDQIGLFAGFEGEDAKGNIHWGYNMTPDKMIKSINIDKTPKPLKPPVLITVNIPYSGSTKKYEKLQGPTDDWAYYYIQRPKAYLSDVTNSDIHAKIIGDSTINPDQPHCGPQMEKFHFEGRFYNGNFPKSKLPENAPEGLNPKDIVLSITCDNPPVPPLKSNDPIKPVTVYYTKDALNPVSILSGDSTDGVFIHNAYYVGTGIKNGDKYQVKEYTKWVAGEKSKGVGLNWVTKGPEIDTVKATSCFQAMIDSLARDVVIGFNCGTIPITAGTTFDSSIHKVYEPQYKNLWNEAIVTNSDSYGMAYSDGAGDSKVLFHPSADSTVKVFIFNPDDPSVRNYYSKN
ncbi:MAG TPA: hypothetical protein QF753_04875 [Victivallales bacterium]|nr:hypothetical protein [Victivallales bacterium]